MDTKYNTPGALDNAAGVAVLLQTAELLDSSIYDIDIVPFNSEEFYGANGELEYLKLLDSRNEKIMLMINIDSPCHKGSKSAVSCHNFHDSLLSLTDDVLTKNHKIVKGREWYAGDHVPFVFRGMPCMVVTSSDFFDGALDCTHTPKDTLHTIDFGLVSTTSQYLADVVSALSSRELS